MKYSFLLFGCIICRLYAGAQTNFGIQLGYNFTKVTLGANKDKGWMPFAGFLVQAEKQSVTFQTGLQVGYHQFEAIVGYRSPGPGTPNSIGREKMKFGEINFPLVALYKIQLPPASCYVGGGASFSLYPGINKNYGGSLLLSSAIRFKNNMQFQASYHPLFFYKGDYEPYKPYITEMNAQFRAGICYLFGKREQPLK